MTAFEETTGRAANEPACAAQQEKIPNSAQSAPGPAALAPGFPPTATTPGSPTPSRFAQAVSSAVHDLLLLLPGKNTYARLDDGSVGLVLNLDAETWALTEPVVKALSHCRTPETPAAPPQDSIQAHVLIVDDDPISRLLLRRSLEQLPGCRVRK